MKISDFRRYALSWCAGVAMLAGCAGVAMLADCGGSTPLSPLSAGVKEERTHARPSYSELYSFEGSPGDGAYPYARLNNVNGTLYGTTSYGGAQCFSSYGCGTVFSITTSGTEKLLYSFGKGGSNDGADPTDDLIAVAGTLYGTTSAGGAHDDGTVFAMTLSGEEKVLHGFKGSPDGFDPFAGLINVKGTLYGTTEYAGANGAGTVFAVTTSGKEAVLYSFAGAPDGADPYARLIDVNGTLYGTTYYGGSPGCYSDLGCGTVFSITTSGKERVVHSFGAGTDGENPFADLINVNGTLYGTTLGGGAHCAKHRGCGTVFSITTSGAETVLHSFRGSGGGRNPGAGLIDVNGTLYGTTLEGGASDDGTVFSLAP
ncbi:MAG: choice-of-anchor tandem repeat GloVer-containing protein [Candidatus Cybelea sp.]